MAQVINGHVVFDPTDLSPYCRTLGDLYSAVDDLAADRVNDPEFRFDYPGDDEYPPAWTRAIESAAVDLAEQPHWRDRLLAIGIESGSGQVALWEYDAYVAELGDIASDAYDAYDAAEDAIGD